MIFRWLLVPMLPVVGLFVGLMLAPRPKPSWEMTLPPNSQCAGVVADSEMTYLLLYTGQIHELDMPAFHLVTGIDISTGAELFSRKIPCDRNEEMQLLPGTTYALRWNRINHDARITLYDWKQEKELNQFQSPEVYYDGPRYDFKNDALAVATDTLQTHSLKFWHLQGNSHLTPSRLSIRIPPPWTCNSARTVPGHLVAVPSFSREEEIPLTRRRNLSTPGMAK